MPARTADNDSLYEEFLRKDSAFGIHVEKCYLRKNSLTAACDIYTGVLLNFHKFFIFFPVSKRYAALRFFLHFEIGNEKPVSKRDSNIFFFSSQFTKESHFVLTMLFDSTSSILKIFALQCHKFSSHLNKEALYDYNCEGKFWSSNVSWFLSLGY